MHAGAEIFIQRGADPHQDAPADQIENGQCDKQARRQDRQGNQCRNAAAWQDPVIDLQHKKCAGQHKQVAHAAEQADTEKGGPAGGQRHSQFRTWRNLRGSRI